MIISTEYLYEKFVDTPIQAHHKLQSAKCGVPVLLIIAFVKNPGGRYFKLPLAGIIAPQYRLALSFQKASNIAGTPPQVYGRS